MRNDKEMNQEPQIKTVCEEVMKVLLARGSFSEAQVTIVEPTHEKEIRHPAKVEEYWGLMGHDPSKDVVIPAHTETVTVKGDPYLCFNLLGAEDLIDFTFRIREYDAGRWSRTRTGKWRLEYSINDGGKWRLEYSINDGGKYSSKHVNRPQRKDGTFNWDAVADDVLGHVTRRLRIDQAEAVLKANQPEVDGFLERMGIEKWSRACAVYPGTSADKPIRLKIELDQSMSVIEATRLVHILQDAGVIKHKETTDGE